jgi:hypothetical protein
MVQNLIKGENSAKSAVRNPNEKMPMRSGVPQSLRERAVISHRDEKLNMGKKTQNRNIDHSAF